MNSPVEGSSQLKIVRGAVDSLSLYEITDFELEGLERGSPTSSLFNFAIFGGSVGLSFSATLLTVEISSIKIFLLFLVIAIVGLLSSGVLFVLWRRFGSSTKDLCKKIRARVPQASGTMARPASPVSADATESNG